MHKVLNPNAELVNTNLSCGTLGHLCITLSPTVCATFSATWVIPPPNPVSTPVVSAGTTGPKAASICYAHDATMPVLNTFRNVDHAFFQKLMVTVEDNSMQMKHMSH